MDVDGFVRDYYEALRRGEPLDTYFQEGPDTVKIGVFSRRLGGEAVAEALRDQTARTEDWTVESRDLRTFARDGFAHFVDDVRLVWTDTRHDHRHDVETRWTGLVEPRGEEPLFLSMHVSAGVERERTDRSVESARRGAAGPQSDADGGSE
jgi:hypothetical protein